jgi:SEC-C motif
VSLHPRNAPCPCGSGVKYKRCCIGREAELERRADATAELFGLAAVFPLLRPSDVALETWADTLDGEEVTREVLDACVVRAGERECERIAGWVAKHHPDIWAQRVDDFGDANEAETVVVAGSMAQFLHEERSLEPEQLDHLHECPDCSADYAVALASVLQPCDLWSVADAATLDAVPSAAGEELDEAGFEAVVDATAAELWTDEHEPRLALLVQRVRRCLPESEWPQASEVLAAACARFERDEALRRRVVSLMLAETLGPLGAIELALSRAA